MSPGRRPLANKITWPALHEGNDEQLLVTLTTNQPTLGTALDLTGRTIEAVLKPTAGVDDDDAQVWTGSSAGADPAVTVIDADEGRVQVAIPASVITPRMRFLRVDVIDADGLRKTGPYGPVPVVNL